MARSFRFYSTMMVAICLLLGIVVYGGGRYSFGVFMKPLAETMGWTRTEISLAVTINLVCYGIFSPVIGWLFDTIGARKVMISGGAILMLSLCAMYFAHNLWLFYLLYGVLSALGANAVGRISQATIVANWFVKRRGFMMGVTAVSVGLGTAIMAPVVRAILDAFGWQTAFLVVGVMVGFLVLLPIILFVKGQGRPEDRGFGPDGVPLEQAQAPSATGKGAKAPVNDADWSAGEALRSRAFWAITISMGLSYLADYIVLLHGPASFEDRGFSGTTAAFLLSMATLASCIGRLGFGWLADNVDMKIGFTLFFGFQLIATPFMILGDSIYMLYAFAFIWGIGYGGAAVYKPYAFSVYFGRSSFSTIYGVATMMTVFFGAAGSTLGGVIYDTQKSYDAAWYFCGAIWAIAIVMMWMLGGKPERKIPGAVQTRPAQPSLGADSGNARRVL